MLLTPALESWLPPKFDFSAAAAGWAKFHGRNSGRSASVLLHPDDAASVRGRRRGEERTEGDLQQTKVGNLQGRGGDLKNSSEDLQNRGGDIQIRVGDLQNRCDFKIEGKEVEENELKKRLEEVKARGEERVTDEDDGTPPPLPPKPRQKISVMGSPNTEHFIVMDNSALFSARQKREGEEKEEKKAEEKEKTALQESHSRSDSGLSSLSSWTAVSKSGCSSVRSSSIVSDCSSKIEELLEEEVGTKTFLSTCSLKLENLIEHDEMIEKQEAEEEKVEEEEEYDDVCQSSSAVQRQLETIRQQKSDLIRQIMVNEEVGRGLAARLEAVTTVKEQEKYAVFLSELEKVVLLVFSVSGRLAKAEEEAEQGNLTDWEKESRRFRRDKLASQLKEAQELRRMSDRRMGNVEEVIKRSLEGAETELELFRSYISKKEELVTAQRACEDLEKNILH